MKKVPTVLLLIFWHPVLTVFRCHTQNCFIIEATSSLVKIFAPCRNCSSSSGNVLEANFLCISSCFIFSFPVFQRLIDLELPYCSQHCLHFIVLSNRMSTINVFSFGGMFNYFLFMSLLTY